MYAQLGTASGSRTSRTSTLRLPEPKTLSLQRFYEPGRNSKALQESILNPKRPKHPEYLNTLTVLSSAARPAADLQAELCSQSAWVKDLQRRPVRALQEALHHALRTSGFGRVSGFLNDRDFCPGLKVSRIGLRVLLSRFHNSN